VGERKRFTSPSEAHKLLLTYNPSISVLTVNPQPIDYHLSVNDSLACYKQAREFNRMRPHSCISRHANVSSSGPWGWGSAVLGNELEVVFDVSLLLSDMPSLITVSSQLMSFYLGDCMV